YKPTPWLFKFSNLFQTIYSALGNFSHTDQLVFERKIIQVPDGGRIALDLTPPGSFDDIADQRSVLITLHGLTGGSHESYVRSVLNPLTSSNRWRAVVLNFRGCAGSQVTTPKLYHAGASDELRLVIRFLKTLIAPDTKVHGIGFSLGANVLAKYLGEESGRSFIRSGVVVGNPWDLYAGHCHLESGPIKRFYSRALASNLRFVLTSFIDFNDLDLIDIDALYSNPNQSLYEFDSIVTKTLLNLPSTEHYYKYNSSTRVVEAVRVPLLSINSIDDPIVSIDAVPIEATISNPNLVMMISKKGGHLGWFEGFWRPRRVIHRPITDWLNSMDQ
ncbi:Alpha/Beta hydrolase protein, partial [Phakopsora pachyrhizi]